MNPRIDESNFQNEYTRNKIRNICIPYIKKEFNPNIIESINRLSEIVREEEKFMALKTEEAYEKIMIEEKEKQIILDLSKFLCYELVIKKRIVLYTINKILGNTQSVQKIHIEDIIKMCEKNVGNKYLMPNKNIKIMIKNKKIFFIDNRLEIK